MKTLIFLIFAQISFIYEGPVFKGNIKEEGKSIVASDSVLIIGYNRNDTIFCAYSYDFGISWNEVVVWDNPDRNTLSPPSLSAGDNGLVFMAWHEESMDPDNVGYYPNKIWFARSVNYGSTWYINLISPAEVNTWKDYESIAFEPEKGYVYIFFRKGNSSDLSTTEPYVLISTDLGNNWNNLVQVASLNGGDHPYDIIAVKGTDTLITLWLNYSSNDEVYVSISEDAGFTWSSPVIINDNTSFVVRGLSLHFDTLSQKIYVSFRAHDGINYPYYANVYFDESSINLSFGLDQEVNDSPEQLMGIEYTSIYSMSSEPVIVWCNTNNGNIYFDKRENGNFGTDVTVNTQSGSALSAKNDVVVLDENKIFVVWSPDVRNEGIYFASNFEPVPPQVNVIYPNGGEVFHSGDSVYVKWNSTDNISILVDSVFYSTDGGNVWYFISCVSDSADSVLWVIPALNSTTCLVKVKSVDVSGNFSFDISDSYFTIQSTGIKESGVSNKKSFHFSNLFFDVSGRKIKTLKNRKGVFFRNEKGKIIRKILKIK